MTSGESFRDVIFPLGGTFKSQVKQIAAKYFKGLNVLSKKESMGICFIGPRSFPEFLGSYISLTAGDFIDWDTGRVVGKHSGKEVYTIGQGAKIGGCRIFQINMNQLNAANALIFLFVCVQPVADNFHRSVLRKKEAR